MKIQLLLISSLLFSFFAGQAQQGPDEEWLRKEIQRIVQNNEDEGLQRTALYQNGVQEIQKFKFSNKGTETYLISCSPDHPRAVGLMEGMPIYWNLLVERVGDHWQTQAITEGYQVEELVDYTGDDHPEALAYNTTCRQGRCYSKQVLYSVDAEGLKEIFSVSDHDFTTSDPDAFPMLAGDTLVSRSTLSVDDLDQDGVYELFVETDYQIQLEAGALDYLTALNIYRREADGTYQTAMISSVYQTALRDFLDDFEYALQRRAVPELLNYFDVDFKREQHDNMLEGRTEQFFREFFCGRVPGYGQQRFCLGLSELESFERMMIIGVEGTYYAMYYLTGKENTVIVEMPIRYDSERQTFGFDGPRG